MLTSEVRFGNLTLRPFRQLLVDGQPVAIGGKALNILSVLAAAEGAVVTKDELFDAVWPGVVVEENAIQAHVASLRKVLGSEAHRLHTVRGLGYRLQLDGGQRIAAKDGGVSKYPSVAILPFANLTGDPAKDYLGDGLADELIVRLSRSSNLRIPARTSTFAYKGRGLDVRRIGDELAVSAICEGSIRTAGDRVRITVQLLNAENGFPLWSQIFDRRLDDLLVLHEEMAAAIADGLSVHLGPTVAATRDPESYHLYLQGRTLWARPTLPNLRAAIELLSAAIDRDPQFARAYFTRASARLLTSLARRAPIKWQRDVLPDIEQSLRIDPQLGEAHAVLAAYHAQTGDWSKSTEAAETAARMDPNDPLLPHVLSNYVLQPTGRFSAAREMSRKSCELAPGWGNPLLTLSSLEEQCGRLADAQRLLGRALDLGYPPEGAVSQDFRIAIAEGRWNEAAESASRLLPEAIRQSGGASAAAAVVHALAEEISKDEAVEAVERLVEAQGFGQVPALHVGMGGMLIEWFAILGAIDRAYEMAEQLVAAWRTSGVLDSFSLIPLWRRELAAFRQDPRFRQLVEELGMVSYWQRYGPPDGYALSKGELTAD
jgi:TolB-like protein